MLLNADVVGVGVDVPPKIMLLLIEQIFTTVKLCKEICLLMIIFTKEWINNQCQNTLQPPGSWVIVVSVVVEV